MAEYIERETAIEWVGDLIDTMSVCTSIDECLGMKSMKSRALSALNDIPAADVVEVRHGRWKDKNGNDVLLDDCGCSKASVWCSECGDWLTASDEYYTRGRYCPNCGAKMTEV